uniref:EOG090X0ADS n=1 Tax=Simocephalus serrulatus TaxID=117539 RepID=A0A4Y7NP53_9CRUS|nr:EOG090X0ADS [Simocephalus serrulatus]SVE94396.1 EOG090X0ADS [Simocephalus serrulatus]
MEKQRKSDSVTNGNRTEITQENDIGQLSPGASFTVFILMEDLIDKMKLLKYETEFAKEFNIKPLSRHYFAIATNPGEQFYMFVILAAWLIRKGKKPFDTPQESDDPNATISNILDFVRRLGVTIEFPPNRLKQGYGEHVVFVLDRLADHALKVNNFSWDQPQVQQEEEVVEEENGSGDELDLEQVEEEMAAQYGSDDDEYDNNLFNINIQSITPHVSQMRAEVLESNEDAEAWKTEVERVIPRLKLAMKPDPRDWRSRLDLLYKYNASVSNTMNSSRTMLQKISTDIEKNMERIETREKYLNTQLSGLLNQYSKTREQLKQVEEKYSQFSVGIEERNRKLNQLNDEIQQIKNELDERSLNMTDGTPLVNLKKVLVRIKGELAMMDVRIGVASHILLQARLKQSTALQHLLLANSTIITR